MAVLAVVADHLLANLIPGFPPGGFVGVDVFFVISGFLITGGLLRKHDTAGRISFKDFYARRAKRLLPAAIATLGLTLVATSLILNAGRAREVLWDTVAALLFSANWRFAVAGTDYFQSSSPPSPLQHFWSLAVEEQFYFVWPVVMLAIFVVIGRKASGDVRLAHRAAGVTMGVIVVGSFIWAIFESTAAPTWAYFSTFSRTWELGIGALLAVGAAKLHSIPDWFRPWLAWSGFAGIIASICIISDESAFPAPWAALPVLATAVVIAAGTGGPQSKVLPLTNPVSQYVGNMSYSLYLVHFPIFVLGSALVGDSWLYIPVVLGATATLGVLFYEFVEPVPSFVSKVMRRIRDRHVREEWGGVRQSYAGLAVLALATATVLPVAFFGQPVIHPTSAGALVLLPAAPSATETTEPPTESGKIAAAIGSSLMASAWPEFNPSIDNLTDQRAPQWTENNCLNVDERNEDLCVYGDPNAIRTAVVMGDSIATSWLPGLISALTPMGYQIRTLTKESCPVAHVQVFPNGKIRTPYTECTVHQTWAESRVTELAPDLVILSNSALSIDRLVSKNQGATAVAEWTEGYSSALRRLPAGAKKITLAPAPGARNMQECYTPLSVPADCIGQISNSWNTLSEAESNAARSAGSAYVDTQMWFCAGQRCPSISGQAAIYTDSSHLTRTYSQNLAPTLADVLLSAGA